MRDFEWYEGKLELHEYASVLTQEELKALENEAVTSLDLSKVKLPEGIEPKLSYKDCWVIAFDGSVQKLTNIRKDENVRIVGPFVFYVDRGVVGFSYIYPTLQALAHAYEVTQKAVFGKDDIYNELFYSDAVVSNDDPLRQTPTRDIPITLQTAAIGSFLSFYHETGEKRHALRTRLVQVFQHDLKLKYLAEWAHPAADKLYELAAHNEFQFAAVAAKYQKYGEVIDELGLLNVAEQWLKKDFTPLVG